MLQSGYLSKDKTFHFGDTNVKDIRGISPTNVINGGNSMSSYSINVKRYL